MKKRSIAVVAGTMFTVAIFGANIHSLSANAQPKADAVSAATKSTQQPAASPAPGTTVQKTPSAGTQVVPNTAPSAKDNSTTKVTKLAVKSKLAQKALKKAEKAKAKLEKKQKKLKTHEADRDNDDRDFDKSDHDNNKQEHEFGDD